MKPFRATYGFTLIEMLLALSLTAVLLTIVSVTIGAVARDNERLKTMDSGLNRLQSVVDILRQDLRQAQTYQMMDGVLTLHGHAGVSSNYSGTSAVIDIDHDPVVIEYEIIHLNNARWLVRRTNAIDATPNQEPTIELLCGGVSGWSLLMSLPEGDAAIPDREPAGPPSRHAVDPDLMAPIPDQVTVSFTLSDPNIDQATLYHDLSARHRTYLPDSTQLNQQYLVIIR